MSLVAIAISVNVQELVPTGIETATWQNWFQTWSELQQEYLPEASGYELSLRFTNDTEIQSLNAQYRQKDQPTDVLAFAALEADIPQSELAASEPLELGDIIISVETAQRQAQEQGHNLQHELAWLASHGFLHLLGWDHPDEDSLQEMLTEQQKMLTMILTN